MDDKITFSEIIKKARLSMDLTLRDLEKRTGISYSHLSKIERGESIPNRDSIEVLAKELKQDVSILLILAGYAPTEISAQLIHELSGEGSATGNITYADIVFFKNKIPVSPLITEIHENAVEHRDDIDEDWAKFIKEMKKRKITPQQLREVLSVMRNIQKYMNQVEIPE